MSAFNTAIVSLFTDPNLAVDAIYASTAGGSKSVRVITHNPDLIKNFGQSVIESPSLVLVAQVSDCPALAQGDTFTIDGIVYTVQGQPLRNAERLVWEVDVYAA
jgi:hypothetical protein